MSTMFKRKTKKFFKEQEMGVIDVEKLTKDYGSGRGVFNVSISVKESEVFGFLGPNGAGKSTTIRHLMGFSKPDGGSTKIFGKETFKKYYEILSKVGYIPGEIALPAGLTGRAFLNMMQSLQGIKNEAMQKRMLDMFELSEVALSGETKRMSLGVKRKLAIVAAFMSDPSVLILDEPTSGLDPVMQERFVAFIHEEKARGKTILLSSHIFSEIDNTCDRIAIIKDGRIVSDFVANDLKHASRKFYTLKFSDEAEAVKFDGVSSRIASLTQISRSAGERFVSVEDKDLNELIRGVADMNVLSFGNRKESLQDYFMKFYKEDKDFNGALK